MRWDRQRVVVLAIAFATIVFTSFVLKAATDGGPGVLTDRGQTPSVVSSPPLDGVQSGATDPESGLPWVLEGELPVQARMTLSLIDRGGPFPYPDKDGSTFGNFEGLLPAHERGYYAEYTVPTPGSADRGARRIIAGAGGEYYWTADHYASFERIARSPS